MPHGSKPIGTSAERIVSYSLPITSSVKLKAGLSNSDNVYIGTSSSVTPGNDPANDGWPLDAAQEFEVPCSLVSDLSHLYVVGGAAS